MHITVDVTFHEDTMYFHHPELQREHYKKVQLFGNTNEEEISLIKVFPTSTSPPATVITEMMPSPDMSLAILSTEVALLLPDTNNQSSTSDTPHTESS